MINMSTKNIISDISEEEYRNLPHISYSKISKFISTGPKSLKPVEKKVTTAINLGSLFDTVLTDSSNLYKKYFIGNEKLNEKQQIILKEAALLSYEKLENIEDKKALILSLLDKYEFQPSYKDTTRLNNFYSSPDVENYLLDLCSNPNKIYITKKELELIEYKVTLLKEHPFTKAIFNSDDCELIFQAKIISDDLMAKCMFDLLLIDHKHRIILPIDFKFMEDSARTFMRSYERFNYYIQDTLYTEVLNYELIKHDLDYTVMEFTFVVLSSVDDIILQYIPEIDYDTVNDLVFVNNKVKKGWKYYFNLIKWHLTNQIFDYTKEEYDHNGIINIPSTNNTNFFSKLTNYGDTNNSYFFETKDDLPF